MDKCVICNSKKEQLPYTLGQKTIFVCQDCKSMLDVLYISADKEQILLSIKYFQENIAKISDVYVKIKLLQLIENKKIKTGI